MPVHYYEKLLQADLNCGVDTAVKRNPAGGQLTDVQVGIHTFAVGQVAKLLSFQVPAVASLGTETTSLTYVGAALGDFVMASLNISLGGLMMFVEVSATNTVTFTFFNPTTDTISLDQGTLRVLVLKSR